MLTQFYKTGCERMYAYAEEIDKLFRIAKEAWQKKQPQEAIAKYTQLFNYIQAQVPAEDQLYYLTQLSHQLYQTVKDLKKRKQH